MSKETQKAPELHFGALDRKKLCIGTYCLADYAKTEAHIADMADCGIDYCIPCTGVNDQLLDLCAKHGVSVIPSGFAHFKSSKEQNEKSLASLRPHPAIAAVDIGDEPSSAEYPGAADAADAVAKVHPGLLPYLNLFPNYANEEQLAQKDPDRYKKYIDSYVDVIGDRLDYICYDNYMYSIDPGTAFENLKIVAEACRRTGKDLWIVLQAKSVDPEEKMHLGQLYFQAFTAMAFGARTINWACWTAGWWHNNILDAQGEKTEVYTQVKAVNKILHDMSAVYMKFRNVDTRLLGHTELPHYKRFSMRPDYGFSFGPFHKIGIDDHCGALAGYFEGEDGERMLLLADAGNACGMDRTNLGSAAAMENFLRVYFEMDPGYEYKVYEAGEEERLRTSRNYLIVEIGTRVGRPLPCKMVVATPKKQGGK